MNKFKKGQKVKIPTTKSVECRIHDSGVIEKAKEIGQDYLIVKYYDKYENHYVVAVDPAEGGDYFAERDLEAYPEDKFKVGDMVKVPTKKTTGIPLDGIKHLLDQHEYLYVVEVEDFGKRRVSISETEGDFLGYVFNQDDLELYVEPKVKVGDKIKVPTQKTGKYAGIEQSHNVKMAKRNEQDHMYIVGYEDGYYIVSYRNDTSAGDFFQEEDLELYVEADPVLSPFLTVPFTNPEPSTIAYKGVDIGEKFEDIDKDIKHIVREVVDTQERLRKLEETPVAVSIHTKEAGSSVKAVRILEVTQEFPGVSTYKALVKFNDDTEAKITVKLTDNDKREIFSQYGTITNKIKKMFR